MEKIEITNTKYQTVFDCILQHRTDLNYNLLKATLRKKDIRVNNKRITENMFINTGDNVTLFIKENYSKYDGVKTYDTNLALNYVNNYLDLDCSNEEWFNKVRDFATENGYASSPKEYKNSPNMYKGHVGDICEALRVMITGRTKSPDLFSIMKILGKERIIERINLYRKAITK